MTTTPSVSDLTYSNFYDFKRAARLATREDQFRPDLTFWISLLTAFESTQACHDLNRQACYEISVAMLMGQGSMVGRGERIASYFGELSKSSSPSALEDATNLLTFCIGAVHQNAVDLRQSQLLPWKLEIAQILENRLTHDCSTTERCFLLELRGHVGLFLDSKPEMTSGVNLDDAFKYWSKLPSAAKDAPLYPLERLSDRLTQFITLFGDDARLEIITEKVDRLLAKRSGSIVAAHKARDRALAFHDRGQIVRAINELHRVKVSWFAQETLEACCTTLLILSQWYMRLGLTYAAKYHALAAAFIGLHDPDESLRRFLTQGLVSAADSTYQQGCWFDFLDLAQTGLSSASTVATTRVGKDFAHDFERTIYHAVVINVLAERLDADVLRNVRFLCERWGLPERFSATIAEAKKSWDKMNEDEIWLMFQDLSGRPFNDVGPNRMVEWKQLGIVWRFHWKNKYNITARAEQLISVLQILLCKIAGSDLCLIEATIDIEFDVGEVVSPKVQYFPSNDLRRWRVVWPAGVLLESRHNVGLAMQEALVIATTVLLDISLLPDDKFSNITDKLFREGLTSAIYTAQSYEILYRQFVQEIRFDEAGHSKLQVPGPNHPFPLREDSALRAFDGPGPGYTAAKSMQAAANRYSNIPPLIRFTLKRLNADSGFATTISLLREEGWLDWHILLAISNSVINYRGRDPSGSLPTAQMWPNKIKRLATTPEEEGWDPIPMSEFSTERLKFFLKTTLLSTVKQWGLENRHQTPLIDPIFSLMGKRFGYWTDDVPHEDFFWR